MNRYLNESLILLLELVLQGVQVRHLCVPGQDWFNRWINKQFVDSILRQNYRVGQLNCHSSDE